MRGQAAGWMQCLYFDLYFTHKNPMQIAKMSDDFEFQQLKLILFAISHCDRPLDFALLSAIDKQVSKMINKIQKQ